MGRGRLEAFSDGVIAIIITIMVLELKLPQGADWAALLPIVPVFFAYVLSFVFIGIYWNNHHHMLQTVERVSASVLWANLHLLFWLSLVPFATGWMGEHHTSAAPTAAYGAVLVFAAVAYTLLQNAIVAQHGPGSKLARAIGKNRKGWASLFCYAAAIPLAFVNPWLSDALYILVALVWLVPDRRIEAVL